MDHGAIVRPVDLRRDLEALARLAEEAFAEEFARRGSTFGDTLHEQRRAAALLQGLGRISPSVRSANLGYVCEEEGEVASVVTFGRRGRGGEAWEIDSVATAASKRRRGMARRLVAQAMRRAEQLGGKRVTLKVRRDNAEAYGLYRSLGFEHYHSTVALKLTAVPAVADPPLDGVRLRSLSFGDWRPRFEVACKATPPAVQRFAPVAAEQFMRPRLLVWLAPVLARLSAIAVMGWVAESDEGAVATLRLLARRKAKMTHELKLMIASGYAEALGEPLLRKALHELRGFPPRYLEAELAESDEKLLPLFERYGFERMETWDWLGRALGSQASRAAR